MKELINCRPFEKCDLFVPRLSHANISCHTLLTKGITMLRLRKIGITVDHGEKGTRNRGPSSAAAAGSYPGQPEYPAASGCLLMKTSRGNISMDKIKLKIIRFGYTGGVTLEKMTCWSRKQVVSKQSATIVL